MPIKLDKQWTDYLLTQPESGMGYQLVDVTFTDGSQLTKQVVTDAQWLHIHADIESRFDVCKVESLAVHKSDALIDALMEKLREARVAIDDCDEDRIEGIIAEIEELVTKIATPHL